MQLITIITRPVSQPAKIWNFESIKLQRIEDNLHFAGINFSKKEKKFSFAEKWLHFVTECFICLQSTS